MKLPLQKALISLCLVGATTAARAQLSGTVSVPSATYPTVTSVVAALNSQGVGTGGLIVNVAAGYTETLTATLSLTATGTSANPITFQKSGAGANPLITAYANASGTATAASATIDGIWNFVGSDYVTINGIDLTENSANNTAAAAASTQAAAAGILMEYGYAFFKTSATDGAQNNTIKNCVVTLNRLNWTAASGGPLFPGSAGIEMMNCTPAATQTNLTVSAASGRSMNNKFYNNTVQNCNVGIALGGYAASSPYTLADSSNDIGGTSAATANSIINFGGGSGATQQSIGIAVRNQWNFNASYNTVTNNNGSGVNHPDVIRGIYCLNSAGASGNVNNNTIQITGGGTTATIYAIDMEAGSTANSNTVNVNNNTIQNCTYSTATTGTLYGIYLNSTATTVNVNNNTLSSITTSSVSGSLYGIYNNNSPTNLSMNGNTLSGLGFGSSTNTATNYFFYNSSSMSGTFTINGNTIQNCTNLNASGDIYFIYNNNSTNTYSVQNNKFSNISRAATLNGYFYGHYNNGSGSGTATLSNNTFNNISASGTGYFYGLHSTTSSAQNVNYTGNKFTNITNGSGNTYLIYNTYGNVVNINNDTINNISSAGDIYAIFNGSGSTINSNVFSNFVNTITTSGANTVYGIYLNANNSSSSTNIAYKNKVYDLNASNASGKAYGIYASSSALHTIYNNLVGDIKAPAATDPNAVVGIYISSVSSASIYNNTVYLNATSSGATFGSSALYVSSTTPTVTSRNNILVNNSAPGSTSGYTAAFRYTSAPGAKYQNASNNNIFYAGTPAANRLIYGEGAAASATNGQQTLTNYKSYIGSARDTFSFTENPLFASTAGVATNYLHFAAGTSTYAESGGVNVSGITDDYDGDIRQGNPGYAGTGSAPDVGADEFNGVALTPAINAVSVSPGVQCTATTHTVTANVSPAPGGTITSVTLNYSYNGTAQTPISMTGGSTTATSNWTATIPAATPANALVTWSVTVFDGNFTKVTNGTSYSDAPMLGLTATATATPPTVCFGTPSVLKVAVPTTLAVGAGALATTGSSSGGNYVSPYSHYYGGYKGQYMIRASELTAAGFGPGDFTALAFDVTAVGTTYTGFAINLSQTTNADMSAGFNLAGQQQVYNTSATPVVGINTYTFTAPFTWDGTSNIIVQVCWSNNNSGGTASEVKYDNTSFVSDAYYRADNQTVAAICGNTSNTGTVSARPKMILTGNKGGLTYSWSNGTTVVGTTSPLTVTPTANTNYTATVKDVNNCSIVSNAAAVTVTPLPATPTATNSTQCGVGVPTASVSGGTGVYKWYSASTGGTLLQKGGSTYTSAISTTTTFYVADSSGLCESNRVAVIASVTTPDSLSAKANGNTTPTTICLGSPVNLTAVKVGTANTYTYKWTANPVTGSNIPATGTAGQNITVTPTAAGTYVYTITGTDASCVAVSTVTVNVNNPFAGMVFTTLATKPTICAGDADTLKASATGPLFTENFESASFPLTSFVTASVSGTPSATQNTSYYAQGSSSVLFNTASTSADVSMSSASGVNLTQYATAKLTFSHIAALEGYLSSYDYGYVQYSTDNGSTWTSFPTSSYAGAGTLFNSVVSFSTLSYSNWTSTLTGASATPTNSLWQNETINIPAAAMTSTQFKVRFRITTDGSINYYGWLIDSVAITGTPTFGISWANGATVVGTGNPQPVTPTTTTTYTPTVTVGGCSTTTTPVTVTVNPLPAATITPSATTAICAGGSIVLTANTGTGFTYQWKLNGSNITGATNGTYTVNAAGNYTVVVTSGSNCSATSAATVITVTPLPTATVTAAGATTFCTGGSVVLNANTGTGLTYVWSRNGTAITGATAAAYTATTAGSYTVTVTSNSCSATSTAVVVTVLTAPTATATAQGPTTFCQGDSVRLVANFGIGLTYVWKRNSVAIAGATNFSVRATLAGTYTVDVSNGGCTTTSNGIVITVNPLPAVTVTATGPTGFCAGGSVTLIASPATGLTYTWKENGAPISGATNSSYTANQTGIYTVTVSNGTCSNTSTGVNVTAFPIPSATITPLTATTICANDTAVLQAPGGLGYAYQWYLNGNVIPGATTQNFVTSTAGNYTVKVTSATGCTATSTTAVTINVFVSPSTTLSHSGPLAICAGSSVMLSVATGTGYTYQWYRNGSVVPGATNSTYNVVSLAGTYTVRVTTPNGCTGLSTDQVVTILPLVYPIISLNGNTLSTAGFTAYQWYLNNSPIPGATDSAYTVTQNGYYTVLGTAPNGCATMSAIASIQFLGIETIKATEVKIYPNPSSSKVNIDAPRDVNVALCGIDGRVLDYVKKAKQIDISNYADGVYMIRVFDENDILVKIEKLIKR